MQQNDIYKLILPGSINCNLSCKYCYIAKVPALSKINEDFIQDYVNGSYLQDAKNIIKKDSLTEIEI